MVDAAKKAIDQIEIGRDAAVSVGGWVRTLAVDEAKGGGDLDRALGLRDEPGWGDVSRETFGSLYGLGTEDVPAEQAPPGSEWMREALSQAKSLPEWTGLQARAAGDSWASGVATAAALDVLAQTLPELPKEDPAQLEEQLEFLGELMQKAGKTSPKHLRRMAELKKRLQAAQQQAADAAQAIRQNAASFRSALRGAATQAAEDIEEAQAAMGGLGVGSDPGQRSRVTAPKQEVLQRLRTDKRLQNIARIAGRLKSQAIRKQAEKVNHSQSELNDIVTGDCVSRLLPSELALLSDPDTEILLYAKLAERRALQYELHGKETKVLGPIILGIDESGSMSGQRDEWAKGVALALCEIAARQNRPFMVLHFDTRISMEQKFEDPKRLDFEEVMNLATHFTGGGTILNVALDRGHEVIAEAKKANTKLGKSDFILITDGEDYDEHAPSVKALHDLGASVYGFAICSEFSEEFKKLLDGYEEMDDSELEGANVKLDKVFSI